MPGKKSGKQRRREMEANKSKLKKVTAVDLVRIGKSTDKGRKW